VTLNSACNSPVGWQRVTSAQSSSCRLPLLPKEFLKKFKLSIHLLFGENNSLSSKTEV